MNSNTKQIVLIAFAAGLFAAVMLTGVLGNVMHGNYMVVPLVAAVLLLTFLVVWAGTSMNRHRVQLMFRKPTPDQVIDHYHASLLQARARKIPHAEAATAHLSALAAAVYGEYDRARRELATVEWEKEPPVYRGHRLHLLALLALLEKQDPASALRLAAEARALEAADSAGGLPILDGAIMVAAGEGSPEDIKRIQRAASRQAGAMPALCAWALSLYCERNGQEAEAAEYRRRTLEAAPHFIALAPAKPRTQG